MTVEGDPTTMCGRFTRTRDGWVKQWNNLPQTRRRVLSILSMVLLFLVVGLAIFIAVWVPWQREGKKRPVLVEEPVDFIKIHGTQFDFHCRPYYIAGFNAHDLVEIAMVPAKPLDDDMIRNGQLAVRHALRQAAALGLNTVRTWAHTSQQLFPFQQQPGVYNEAGLRALDYVLDEARQAGLRVVLSFVDNWKYYNGVDQYVDWSPTVPKRSIPRPKDNMGDPVPNNQNVDVGRYEAARHALFFTDPSCRRFYQNHVRTLTHRKNSINGRVYRDDPTILAWNMINEPRCESWAVPQCAVYLQKWIEDMSAFIKSQDPNHLVSIGSEGFFGRSSSMVSHNPSSWAADMGQDFVCNNLAPHVDFATIHAWPDNWNAMDPNFLADWLKVHALEAQQKLRKPLLMEEFGKKLPLDSYKAFEEAIFPVRDPVYATAFAAVERALLDPKDHVVMGSMFWRWHLTLYTNEWTDAYGVLKNHTTTSYVANHTRFIRQYVQSTPGRPGCRSGCWVGVHTPLGERTCQDVPRVCGAYWDNKGGRARPNIISPFQGYPQENPLPPPVPPGSWEPRALQSLDFAFQTQPGTTQVNVTAWTHTDERLARTIFQKLRTGRLGVYPTELSCCQPGRGAFDLGCTHWGRGDGVEGGPVSEVTSEQLRNITDVLGPTLNSTEVEVDFISELPGNMTMDPPVGPREPTSNDTSPRPSTAILPVAPDAPPNMTNTSSAPPAAMMLNQTASGTSPEPRQGNAEVGPPSAGVRSALERLLSPPSPPGNLTAPQASPSTNLPLTNASAPNAPPGPSTGLEDSVLVGKRRRRTI